MRLKVVLTNDDGPDSPLLAAFAEAIAAAVWCRELRLVVPARERSWIGKAITRFDPLTVSALRIGGLEGYAVQTLSGSAGTPADCVELALWNLYPDRADLVLSGINIGANAGLAFTLSSGTVGGAIEASLNGVPGIALSADVPKNVHRTWGDGGLRDGALLESWKRLAGCAVRICGLLAEHGAPSRAPRLSINLPWQASEKTPVRMTRVKRTAYRGLFEPDPDAPSTFRHRFPGFTEEAEAPSATAARLPSDLDTLARGEISLSVLGALVEATEDHALTELLDHINGPTGH